ncbi:MAG: glucosamine-6-phosphate deaminase [Clostridiales bacterium]|jgi:glucosamine-6-phosphate deaminase|nr:glucosamine-6-phosphate deaminase [Clostridiales bacterium]
MDSYCVEKQFDKLRVQVYGNRDEMGKAAASRVAAKMRELIEQKGKVRMVFASAPSQLDFLKYLREAPGIDWSKVTVFHLDEYMGASIEDEYSFAKFIKEHIVDKVKPGKVYYMNGKNPDIEGECERYSNLISREPIDIVCLGIGENGHIAFNEPHEADFNDPRLVKKISLDEKCRNQQYHDFGFASMDDVPRYAITMTVPAITGADYLYCIVPTDRKAEAVKETLTGPITEKCPASILRTHDNAVLFLDRDAAKLVEGLI